MPVLTLPTLLRLFTRDQDPSHVEVVPELAWKRIEGAKSYASFGAETPLAIIDDTTFGSGKEGVLVTAAAIYFSSPRARLALDRIKEVPTYPQGPDAPGVLPAKEGPVPLAALSLAPSRTAFHRVMNAISWKNLGSTDYAAPSVPLADSPVGESARKHLIHRDIELPSLLKTLAWRAIGAAFQPLDTLRGEEVIAFVDDSDGNGNEGILVTSERFLYRRGSTRLEAPFAAIRQAEAKPGVGHAKLVLTGERGVLEMTLIPRNKMIWALAAFADELVKTSPPEARVASRVIVGKKGDASGATAAIVRVGSAETRATALCMLIGDSVRSGAMPAEIGTDLAHRVCILAPTLTMGRGEHRGLSVSAMPGKDLVFALRTVLGAALREAPIEGGYALEFPFAAPIASVRVEVRELGGFSGFVLLAGGPHRAPLASSSPEAFASVSARLAEIELQMLLLRTVQGWTVAPHELYALPPAAFAAKVKALTIMPFDLARFGLVAR